MPFLAIFVAETCTDDTLVVDKEFLVCNPFVIKFGSAAGTCVEPQPPNTDGTEVASNKKSIDSDGSKVKLRIKLGRVVGTCVGPTLGDNDSLLDGNIPGK